MFDAIALAPLAAEAEVQMDAGDRGWAFAAGWSGVEQLDGRSVRWNDGDSSTLLFHLDPVTAPYRLRLEIRPYAPTLPQTVTVELNGVVLEALDLEQGWRDYEVDVPAGLLRVADNELRLDYAAETDRATPINRLSGAPRPTTDTRRLVAGSKDEPPRTTLSDDPTPP